MVTTYGVLGKKLKKEREAAAEADAAATHRLMDEGPGTKGYYNIFTTSTCRLFLYVCVYHFCPQVQFFMYSST